MIGLARELASLFWDTSPTPPSTPRRTAWTRQQVVAVTCFIATVYILLPDRFYLKQLCFVPLLGWLAGLLFDLREALFAAWDRVPPRLRRWLGSDTNVPNNHPSALGSLNLGGTLSAMTARLGVLAAATRTLAIQLQQAARAAAIRLARTVLGLLEDTPQGSPNPDNPGLQGASTSPPKYTAGEWHGILVQTPPVHDYGFSSAAPKTSAEPIPWEQHDTSAIPSMMSSLVFCTHLSFCLVEKSVWESRHWSIERKLMAGVYWDISGVQDGNDGIRWGEREVRTIIGLEDLGPVETHIPALENGRQHYASLRRVWDYSDISWNDVDFAIILGFLVTGNGGASKSKAIFGAYGTVRRDAVMAARVEAGRKLVRRGNILGATGFIVTAVTGGLAGPFLLPLIAVGAAATFKTPCYDAVVSVQSMLKKREVESGKLVRHFPQLAGIFDMRDDTSS